MEARTLADVLSTVDATVLRHAAGPAAAEISDVVILDWTEHDVLRAGALVLAVGVEPDRPVAATLLDRAGRAGAAAVVVRCDGELPEALVSAAERAGVALLTAPPGVAWGQLYALLRTALASGARGSEPGSGAAGVSVGDLFSLADAIAAAVGGPVTIEDPQWRVLAYSNLGHEIDDARRHTILGRTPPPEWQERIDASGVAQALRRDEGVVRFEADGITPRLAAPVRAGGELLGSVWLAAPDGTLADDAEEQLRRAAELSAMHLLAHRASEDVKRRARGASVREILDGLGVAGHRSPPAPLSVVAFDARTGDRGEWLTAAERVLSVVSLFAEATHREAMCALVDERIWALVPTPAPEERLVELAERVEGRVRDVLGIGVVGVVGPSVGSVREVPRTRAAAERALAVLARDGSAGPVVHVDDVRAPAILHELLELAAERPSLADGPLSVLAENGRDQVETLRAWLDCHGDVGAAATRLGVHPNTLRYRLRRIAEVTGLDLADPDERLVTEFQLRLLDETQSRRA